jgi:hypothetical protein
MLHRLAFLYMTDNMPDEVDHIDRNPKNNAWANLRPASRLLNNLNRGIQKNNTSGYTGVSRSSNKQKWVSHIRVNGIRIALGVFDDLDNAVAARKRAELEFWGNLQV